MIHRITIEEAKLLNELSWRYLECIESGEINPQLIEAVDLTRIKQEEGWIIKEGQNGIEGLLKYEILPERSLRPISNKPQYFFGVNPYLDGESIGYNPDLRNVPGFKDYKRNGDLAYLNLMESFQKGIGRELVDDFKKIAGIELILCRSFANVIGFYEKMGFAHTGILGGENQSEPTMVWINPS